MKKTNLLSLILSISLILSACTNSKTEIKENPSQETTSPVVVKEETSPPIIEIEEETTPQTEPQPEPETEPEPVTEPVMEPEPEPEPVIVENTYYIGFGFIDSLYTYENNNYLAIDEAEFFWNPEALEEAIKDGKAFVQDDGTYIIYNGYYIRNNYNILTDYPLAENCKFYLSTLIFDHYSKDNLSEFEISENLKEVPYDEFTNAISIPDHAPLRVWFEVENGYVTEISHQFTP